MRGLIYKDLYLIRHKCVSELIMILLLTAVVIVLTALPGDVPVAAAPVMALFVNMYIVLLVAVLYNDIIKIDTTKEWGFYSITIPGTEKEVIAAKYIVVFIVYFIAFVICTVIDIIMGIIYGTSVDSSMAVFALILVNIFLNAVEMPLCYRFGSERGGLIRIAITLFVVVVAVTYLLFGNIEWLMGEDGIFWIIKDAKDKDINIMNVAFDRVSKALKNLSLLGVIISSMIPHIVVVVYYISYRISCKVYKKGVVRDDI